MMTLRRPPRRGFGEQPATLAAIQNLFARGELGGYWPADPAYAFEDSYGNVPVSINAVVGLRLDVSKNLALGPELNRDVGFNNPGWWVIQDSWSIADGVASNDGSNVVTKYVYILTYISLVSKLFLAEWDVLSLSVNGIDISQGGFSGSYCGETGHYVKRVGVTNVDSNARIYVSARAGSIATVDNISLKQILGNHAFQPTTANKPYLRRTPVSGKSWYDSNTSTGELTATFSGSLGSACTIVSVTPEGISILENQTVGSTYNICPPFGYNADVLIINRALTAAEKTLVTRVMQRSVPTLGSNLAVNGGFSADTDWTKGSGWSIAGTAAKSAGTASNITQTIGVSGNQYRVTADITRTAGTVGAYNGSAQIGATAATETAAKYAMKTTSTTVGFRADSSFTGSVDNAVIQEIL